MEAPNHALFPVSLNRVEIMDFAIVMADSSSVWYLVARCEALTTDYAVITSINTWPSDKVKTLTASLEAVYYMYHTHIVSCTQRCSN
ncbi:hypothetical protein JG688_00014751 [Phytophthora aleatoria]|uniref:Uncharacterized protein n=1 Tax=Phytophthora aleatoria TaxID=2496075 RepID=A0A8J5M067_9STRA|nr:hypothetical protein JG688_00014751 [Phytophthora aleatoria]